MAKRVPSNQEGADGEKGEKSSREHRVTRRALIASGRRVVKRAPAIILAASLTIASSTILVLLARRVLSGKRAPGDQEGVKWLRGRQVTRKALMARRARSDRERADCYEAPNG